MTAQEITLVPAQHAQGSCSCGCASCTGTCCRLDCLDRPRFYCGQLLTDRDLTGLVDWTLDKVRLGRFRHGWGVVCGLDVRCDPDPRRHAHVIVTPGYAVSCCGDDIVVCEETMIDLGDACRKQTDLCSELRRSVSGHQVGTGPEAEQPIPVDLFIHYEEQPQDPQTAFGRSACREVSVCEPSRTREAYRLSWRPASSATEDPVAKIADRWMERYATCHEFVDNFKLWYEKKKEAWDVQRWLFNWITEHPLHHFCFIRDRICARPSEDNFRQEAINGILFFLVQDSRNAFLQCGCFECQADDAGVRLARIYLLPETRNGKLCCRVQAIVPYPPYRRRLSLSCWPAKFGDVNLGGAIWLPWTEARSYLRDLDITVEGEPISISPQDVDELIDPQNVQIVFKAGTTVQVLVLQDPDLLGGVFDQRVVGFKGIQRQ